MTVQYGVTYPSPFPPEIGGQSILIEFDSEQSARDFITATQPNAGVTLTLARFEYANYELLEDE